MDPGEEMNVPIRGIQVALLVAFAISIIAVALDVLDYLDLTAMAGYQREASRQFWSLVLRETAYSFFYLGEVAIVELLYRIWNGARSSGA